MANKGANKKKCQAYRLEGIREKNKIRKLKKHLKIHIADKQATKALNNV